jgi:hypothetical protein
MGADVLGSGVADRKQSPQGVAHRLIDGDIWIREVFVKIPNLGLMISISLILCHEG